MSNPYAGIASWKFKLKDEIHSYEDAHDFVRLSIETVDSRRNNDDWTLGANMYVRWRPNYYAIVLYETEIIRYYPDGTFSVDNGGFNTPTTMHRLSAVLPEGWRVWHRDKKLELSHTGTHFWPCTHERRFHPEGREVSQ